MLSLHRGRRRKAGIDAVLGLRRVAGDLEVHQRGVAVRGDLGVPGQRRPHVLDVLKLGEPARHVLDRGPELGIVEGERVALHQDNLGDRPQAGAVKRLLGTMGLTGELIEVREIWFVPIEWPAMKATTTNPSQPKIAILRCAALQHAARSASPRGRRPP